MNANEQIDRLIHEKIMGQPLDVPCAWEKEDIMKSLHPSDGYQYTDWWQCGRCGFVGRGEYNHTQQDEIPAYSTNLDKAYAAAIQQFAIVEIQTIRYAKPEHEVSLYHQDEGSKPRTARKTSTTGTMARLLCETMLQAYGIDVNNALATAPIGIHGPELVEREEKSYTAREIHNTLKRLADYYHSRATTAMKVAREQAEPTDAIEHMVSAACWDDQYDAVKTVAKNLEISLDEVQP